jgi:ATP-binding cassette subfamily B protein RaxB
MAWLESLSLGLRRRLPVILQTEAAECGLACLAMVMGYHGVITDLATLRARHAISLKGMSLASLAKLAQDEKPGLPRGAPAAQGHGQPEHCRPSCTGT